MTIHLPSFDSFQAPDIDTDALIAHGAYGALVASDLDALADLDIAISTDDLIAGSAFALAADEDVRIAA